MGGKRFHPPRFGVRLAGIHRSNFVCRAGYFDGDLAPGFGASAWGLRKAELAGATFLSAFGFLASRLPRCLLPLPIIVHPTCHSAAHYPLKGLGGWHPAVPAHQIDSARGPSARAKFAQADAAQHSTPIECQGGAAASTSGFLTPATRRAASK